ncbi:hypothetical protein GQ457_12G019310 [Hibiscus cannabinus]
MWKVVQGRIPSFSELLKRGVKVPSAGKCFLCSMLVETVEHLFCHCSMVWRVWQKWVNLWKLNLVMPGDFKSFMWWWNSQIISSAQKPFWWMSFFGIVWTIWLCRNDLVFNLKGCKADTIFDLALVRIGFWCKSKWLDMPFSISEFVRNPILCGSLQASIRRQRAKLGPIIWPGDNADSVPKGWEFPTEGKRLKIGNYDAVVGDVTIVANRSLFVDFTLPYTESGVSMLVPIRDNKKKNALVENNEEVAND